MPSWCRNLGRRCSRYLLTASKAGPVCAHLQLPWAMFWGRRHGQSAAVNGVKGRACLAAFLVAIALASRYHEQHFMQLGDKTPNSLAVPPCPGQGGGSAPFTSGPRPSHKSGPPKAVTFEPLASCRTCMLDARFRHPRSRECSAAACYCFCRTISISISQVSSRLQTLSDFP